MATAPEGLYCLGVVTGTHGLRGDLKIRPLSRDSVALLGAPRLFFASKAGDVSEQVPVRAEAYKGHFLLRLRGREDINAVQSLIGAEVSVPFSELPPLPTGEFYWFQLEGMTVVDRSRGELGRLDESFVTAAHEIYVVHGPYGEVLVPVVESFIVSIDVAQRRLDVDLPDGLIPEPDDL